MTVSAAAGSAISAKPLIAATEPLIAATERAIATAEPAVAVEITASVEFAAAEAAGAITATEAGVAVNIPAAPEVTVVSTAERFAALEVSPSIIAATATEPVAAEIAPTVAIAEVPPAIVVVEIDPGGVVKIEVPAAVERWAIKSAEPWASADENAADKPLRPVIAIRRACVWRVWIVAVRADRRPRVHGRANADSNSNTHLRISRARHHRCKRDDQADHCGVS